MQERAAGRVLTIFVCLLSMILTAGCAGMEKKEPDRLPVHLYYPAVLVFAEQALKEAREAGKDKLCPEEYKKAAKAVEDAYEICMQCTPLGPIPINIECPAPTCELKADKKKIRKGESVKLTMTTHGEVTSAKLEGTDMALSKGGTVSVQPSSSRTFTANVVGPRGSGTCSDHVEVDIPPPPTCTLTADKNEIMKGESVKLTMTTYGEVTSAKLDGTDVVMKGESVKLTMTTYGEVTSAKLDGTDVVLTGKTVEVKPVSAKHYTGIVEGPGGSNTCSVPVSLSLTLDIYFPFDRPDDNKDDLAKWFGTKDAYDTRDLKDPSQRGSIFINNNLGKNRDELKKAVEFVRNSSSSSITVEGYTDRMGSFAYNRDLSLRRATAVANYLIAELAIDPKAITATGKGKEEHILACQQLTPGGKDNAECRALNRRVKITAKPIPRK